MLVPILTQIYDMSSFLKITQGSFHQGHEKFGLTRGRQCTCCSLFSIAFSAVKNPGYWNARDIDFVVENGDRIFKQLNPALYLDLDQLPREIKLMNENVAIGFLGLKCALISSKSYIGSIIDKDLDLRADGFLFIINEKCVSVTWNKRFYFLFDSHSRDNLGKTSADGTATVIKFSSKNNLERFILSNFLKETDENVQFELQLISVDKKNLETISGNYKLHVKRSHKATPEAKQKARERRALPEVKERERWHRSTPEVKERKRQYRAMPDVKERERRYRALPEVKERERKRSSMPEVKEKKRLRRDMTDVKERERKRRSIPAVIERERAYRAKLEVKERKRARRAKPEVREKRCESERKRRSTAEAREKDRKRKAAFYQRVKIRKQRIKAVIKNKIEQKHTLCKLMRKRIEIFKKAIQEGPYYICVICNRCLYRKTVKHFNATKYDQQFNFLYTSLVKSFDSKLYVCITCDQSLMKKKVPCQAVWNKMNVDEMPNEIQELNRLEKVLVSKRILFKKLTFLPRGQQPRISGSICNIPVQVNSVTNCLPRETKEDLLFVKLKRKIVFKGHVYFESVRPHFVDRALNYLKMNNPFYSDVLINLDNINRELLSLTDPSAMVQQDEFPVSISGEDEENLEDENPLDNERVRSDEMCTVPNIYTDETNTLEMAPGENKSPLSFFNDEYCEEQAFPYLFPKGKYGHKTEREVPISPVKYFNSRLLNFKQRFSSCIDYIFYAQYLLLQLNIYSRINIALKKISGCINVGQLRNNFKETLR